MDLRNSANEQTETNYKRIVIDVDGTLCEEKCSQTLYSELEPKIEIIELLREYKKQGFYIIIYSSRQMRTYNNNIGKITTETVPVLLDWLKKYDVPYDELYVGKPWCGFDGFYVDDKTIRPSEFLKMPYEEIQKLLGIKKEKTR